jgi:hypothetical protein
MIVDVCFHAKSEEGSALKSILQEDNDGLGQQNVGGTIGCFVADLQRFNWIGIMRQIEIGDDLTGWGRRSSRSTLCRSKSRCLGWSHGCHRA